MSERKNQHFVPKCYFKPFSKNGEGRAINLYNIRSDRSIADASVVGQCSKNFFYGRDLKLEKALGMVEGFYSRAVKNLHENGILNSDDIEVFKHFTFLQHFRTNQNIEMLKNQHQNFIDKVMMGPTVEINFPEMKHEDIVEQAISIFATSLHLIEDLDVCVFDNLSKGEFFTSDDPAIVTNKFNFQKIRQISFGLSSSGILYFLPLSPRYLFMMYDPNVYYVEKKSFLVEANKKDISALNSLQYIRAHENIYFSNWDSRCAFRSDIEASRKNRPDRWYEAEIFIRDESYVNGARYKSASNSEINNSYDSLISLRPVHLYPKDWPSKLRYRLKPITVNTNSSLGHIRPAIAARRMMGLED